MAYQEYFNYLNCNHNAVRYGDTANADETTHFDYNNSHNNHCNTYGIGCETGHSDHANYINAPHYNYMNHQTNAHSNYSNHTNYANPNSGATKTLTWTSPWSGNTLSSTYIAESVGALKQIRDNLRNLSTTKSQQSATVDVATSSPNVGDSEFNDSNPSTPEFIEDNQFDAIRDSLNNLWASIKGDDDGSTPLVPDRSPGDKIQKTDWELLKTKSDTLAGYDDSGDYANTVAFSGITPLPPQQGGFGEQTTHTNHANYLNSQDVPYTETVAT